MRISALCLYAGLLTLANAAAADLPARQGEMARLVPAAPAATAPQVTFQDAEGRPRSLSEWRGKIVVLNFWALSCPPCRAEMPALDRLQAAMGDRVAVIAVASGPNPPTRVAAFLAENDITHLTPMADPSMRTALGLGAPGLPVTVVFGRDGHELGRLIGGAEWDAPEVVAFLDALLAEG